MNYLKAATLEEAQSYFQEQKGARFIAGGTDLLVQMDKGKIPLSPLISLRGIEALGSIDCFEDRVELGALITLRRALRHESLCRLYPDLVEAMSRLGSTQIRSVATFGGNLCNASPVADLAPPLMVHETTLRLSSLEGEREISLEDFLLGPGQTALKTGEILVSLTLPVPPPGTFYRFYRKSRVHMDLALAQLSLALSLDEKGEIRRLRLAAGSVAPRTLRLRKTEAFLEGTNGFDVLEQARQKAMEEVAPISDQRASADYRRELIGVFFKRGLKSLLLKEGEK
jgi:carbon-monoxide dehydrogenase medium subunit